MTASVLIAVAAGVVGLVVLRPPAEGERNLLRSTGSDLRGYIGQQILSLVNNRLSPQLSFDTLAYEAPFTVLIDDAALTAPDGTEVIRSDQIEITLGERPRTGRPVVISRMIFNGGAVRIVKKPDGSIAGFDPFVRAEPDREPGDDEPFRLSDFIRLERIEINGADLVYDDGAEDADPLRIDGLTAGFDIEPAGEPGWYRAVLTSGREPGLRIEADGRFNIDELLVELDDTTLAMSITPETIPSLPPTMQRLLAEHDVRGSVSIDLAGGFPIRDPLAGNLRAELNGESMSATFGEYRVPAERLHAVAVLEGGSLDFRDTRIDFLDGAASFLGAADLAATNMPGSFTWRAEGIRLSDFLASRTATAVEPPVDGASADEAATNPVEEKPPALAGLLSGQGNVRMDLARAQESLGGEGRIAIREGRLVKIPLVSRLGGVLGARGEPRLNHELDAAFMLRPDRVQITEATFTGGSVAARGSGAIYWDGQLDLQLNGGPLEKIQSKLGAVGDLFGKITDSLGKYVVTGTMDEPSIKVVPLGLGGG